MGSNGFATPICVTTAASSYDAISEKHAFALAILDCVRIAVSGNPSGEVTRDKSVPLAIRQAMTLIEQAGLESDALYKITLIQHESQPVATTNIQQVKGSAA